MADVTVDPKTHAPWPVPVGWTYSYEDGPGIERKVGNYTLDIGDDTDDGKGWSWWVSPVGCPGSLEQAIFAAADAMFKLMSE